MSTTLESVAESPTRPEIRFLVGGEHVVSRRQPLDPGERTTIDVQHRTYPAARDVEFPVSVGGTE